MHTLEMSSLESPSELMIDREACKRMQKYINLQLQIYS